MVGLQLLPETDSTLSFIMLDQLKKKQPFPETE